LPKTVAESKIKSEINYQELFHASHTHCLTFGHLLHVHEFTSSAGGDAAGQAA
jgi:hypothetical protein